LKQKKEVIWLKEFIKRVTDLLEKKEEIFSLVDASDLWIFVINVKEHLNKLKNDILDIPQEIQIPTKEIINEIDDILKIIDRIQELIAKCPRPEDLVFEVVRNNSLCSELCNQLIRVRKGLEKVRGMISSALDKLLELSLQPFRGRISLERDRTRQDVEELLKDYERIIQRDYSDSFSILRQLSNIIRISNFLQVFKGDTRALHVARQLMARITAGLWAKEILDILTGLQSITAEPISEFIKFNFESEDDGDELVRSISVDELFYRYPPFEPIAIKKDRLFSKKITIKVPISGNFVWFVDTDNLSPGTRRNLEELKVKNNDLIIRGKFEDKISSIEILEVSPIDILDNKHHSLVLQIRSETGNKVWIKYGSTKIVDAIKRCFETSARNIEDCLQRMYVNYVRKYRPRARAIYSATNLSYAWFCILGLGLSTDPWDFRDCPFKKYCYIGRNFEKERCKYWSYSRRIFPKVFPKIRRRVYSLNVSEEAILGIIHPILAREVRLVEEYMGAQWTMPSYVAAGIPVSISFIKPITRVLPRTNVVGFAIPLEIIYNFAENLLDDNFQPKPRIRLLEELETDLKSLVLTKFYLWREGDRGYRIYNVLRKSKNKIIESYKKFINKLEKDEKLLMEFKNFICEVLGHSLAHLLVSYLASSLNLEERDLVYYYDKDEDNGYLFVLVAENSPYGNLDLPGHIEKRFNTLNNMIDNFINNIISLLNNHQKELDYYSQAKQKFLKQYINSDIGRNVQPLVSDITNYYRDLVNNGLILDSWHFNLHLLLSRLYERLSNYHRIDLSVSRKELANILTYSGPHFCIDGCTGCLLFEHGCHMPLEQILSLSKNLTHFFLHIFFGSLEVVACSDKLGPVLLRLLPKRSLLVVSPYVDLQGIFLLNRLAKEGIEVTLITRKSSVERFLDYIKFKVGSSPYMRHEKKYLIDDYIIIHSTWNLTVTSKSTNSFRIEINPKIAKVLKTEFLKNVRWFKHESLE